jgi:protein TonB
MPRDLFAVPPDHPESRRSTRLLPISILLHVILIGGAVIAPLLATGELPKIAGTRTPPLIVKAVPVPEVVPAPVVRRAGPLSGAPRPSAPPVVPPSPSGPSFNFEEVVERGDVPIGGDIQAPRKIRHVAPEYPAIAQQVRRQGTVVIDAIIGPDGRVTQATIRQSVQLLDQAALAAVRQWVYTPTKLNGTPVAVIMTVEVNFRLQ